MNIIKKQNFFGWAAIAAVVLALVAMIIYISSSTTGYLSGQNVNSLPIVFTILAMLLLVACAVLAGKLDNRIIGGALFVAVILLAVSVCVFVNERVELFADVYFIPVNYPEGEGSTLSLSIVGMVFYIISIVCLVVSGFGESLAKKQK